MESAPLARHPTKRDRVGPIPSGRVAVGNMAHPKPNKPSPASVLSTHRELLACLIRAGELNVEWKLVQRTALVDSRLPKSARMAIALVASRAQSKCVAIADAVIPGMLCLVRNQHHRAARLLRSCDGHMTFLSAADRTVAAVIRKSTSRTRHGN
jgi:hypothetical protein